MSGSLLRRFESTWSVSGVAINRGGTALQAGFAGLQRRGGRLRSRDAIPDGSGMPGFPILTWSQLSFALRLVAAALLAYGLSALLGFAHGYSAVFSALIVVRPYQQGAWRAAAQRLLATAIGIGTAFVSVMLHKSGLNDFELLAIAIAPLSLLVAYDSGYRTSMISALLMLSVPFARVPELDIAVARAIVVALGAVVGIAVSLLVLPQPLHRIVAAKAIQVIRLILTQMRDGFDPAKADLPERARLSEKADGRLRKHLLELGQMARDHKTKTADEDASSRIVGITRHMQALSLLLRSTWRAKRLIDKEIGKRYNLCNALLAQLIQMELRLRNRKISTEDEASRRTVQEMVDSIEITEGAPESWLLTSLARDLNALERLI
ncbi:MAG: FUSC family protein [Asticcacaulis sp.]